MKHPAYHLRTNKAVDRLLLADVIYPFGPDYSKITYYSLAGPFLEDLRVMDHFFPRMRLVSLESDTHTYKRQVFHKFSSNLDLRKSTLADFLIHNYEPSERDVFWLDYTDLSYSRFGEFQSVLTKVPLGSIVRITLRAEPEFDIESLHNRVPQEEIDRIRGDMENEFVDEFRDILPHPTPSAFGGLKEFARTVQLMVRRAASRILDTRGSKRDYLPLHAVRYNDNTQMLSVTGIVCPRDAIAETREHFSSAKFIDFDWNEPIELNIPTLTIKERLHLERHLPIPSGTNAGELLYNELSYKTDRSVEASKRQLAHYAEFYREYPQFIRLAM